MEKPSSLENNVNHLTVLKINIICSGSESKQEVRFLRYFAPKEGTCSLPAIVKTVLKDAANQCKTAERIFKYVNLFGTVLP